MPFIKQSRRTAIEKWGLEKLDEIEPGDRCYVHYKQMVEQWRAEPRWTTAHKIYKDVLSAINCAWPPDDDQTARSLAWQVFFQLYVMPYELQKQKENGDV